LDGKNQKLLEETLARLADETQIQKDNQRLKQIYCCPTDYGFSIPE